ncbi:MAG TPA: hypothetical protein VG273_01875 [Bryobacteraceae bacterium]|nr:hypothetical protein [Bryobacteraceae bacterium]
MNPYTRSAKLTAVLALCAGLLSAQQKPPDKWKDLRFLEGTWEAKTQGGSAAATASGTYTFAEELGGHILARHSTAAGCKAPTGFDCEHGDLLYLYPEPSGPPLRAIYFDNEGHVIHYSISVPAPGSAMFLSDPGVPGPQYRLLYELKGTVMSGKFQMRMPGKQEWTSYLEWSGSRK